MKRTILTLLTAAAVSACTLMPHYQRPQSPAPEHWPADAAGPTAPVPATPAAGSAAPQALNPDAGSARVSADQIGWHDFFTDPRLERLIDIALANNRNLRIAVLNVAESEAQFRNQRGNLFPAISATGSGLAERLPANGALPSGGVGASGSGAQVPSGTA